MFATTLSVEATKSSLERATRIELAFSAWKAAFTSRHYPGPRLQAKTFRPGRFVHFSAFNVGETPRAKSASRDFELGSA